MKARQKFGFNHKRHKTMYNEDASSKAASRILNISGTKQGSFAFPKRERFNEEVEHEIQSQKSNRVHSQMLSSKSLVVKDGMSNRSLSRVRDS